MKRLAIISMLGIMAASCVYPYNADLTSAPAPTIIIDGDIVVGSAASLKVGYMMSFDGRYPEGKNKVSSLKWWVEDEDGTKYEGKDGNADLSAAPADHKYRMVIMADGKTYASQYTEALEPPVIEDIGFVADDDVVRLNVSLKGGTGYAVVQYEQIWQFHADWVQEYCAEFYPAEIQDPEAKYPDGTWLYFTLEQKGLVQNYYCWRKSTAPIESLVDYSMSGDYAKDFLIAAIDRSSYKLCKSLFVKVRTRSLSYVEHRFLTSISNDESQAISLFSPDPGDLPGNVININDPTEKVLGYVSTSKYTTAEVSLDSRYYKKPNDPDDSELYLPEKDEMWEMYFREINPYRPVRWVMLDWGQAMGWAPLRCVDCTYDGGTLTKPDFSF